MILRLLTFFANTVNCEQECRLVLVHTTKQELHRTLTRKRLLQIYIIIYSIILSALFPSKRIWIVYHHHRNHNYHLSQVPPMPVQPQPADFFQQKIARFPSG